MALLALTVPLATFAATPTGPNGTTDSAGPGQSAPAAPATGAAPTGAPAAPASGAPPAGTDDSTAPNPPERRRAPRRQPPADKPPAEVERVEVQGKKSDEDLRRESTAAKIVIGREEIERFGDSTLDEVLKRLPSVSIVGRARRGGSIVMRGLGHGYTQILINGERIPPGFSIDQLVPDQVERIEIYRAPTAETGARAIAGTINIVLREALRIHLDEVRVQLGSEEGRGQSNFSWVRNDTLGDSGAYNVTLSAAQANFLTSTLTRRLFTEIPTGATLLDQDINTEQVDRRDNVHFTSRLQWKLDAMDDIVVQPFFTVSKTQTQIAGNLEQSVGEGPSPYATSLSDGSSHQVLGRLQLQWNHRFGDDGRLELHGYVGGFNSESDALLNEYASGGATVLKQVTDTDINDRSWNFTGKLSYKLWDTHSVVGGFELEGLGRVESASTIQNGVPLLAAFGSDVDASVLRTAAYAQDDWSPAPHWAADAGLRWESIRTTSDNQALQVTNLSDVLTPLAHAVWRFDEPDRDQLRISLTRSYRAPSLQSLVALPTVNTLYPVNQPNVASAPDSEGNPHLKPELATGLDIALEHYDFADGVFSISFFDRNIHDLMRTVTSLQSVLYSPVPRWVAQPVNFGDASTQGIEADAKFQLDELIKNTIPLTVHANVSVYRSNVSNVMGPYNRLDQQPGATANLGFDYPLPIAPVKVGGNFNWTPPFTIQSTNTQTTYFAIKRQLDLYALWTLTPDTKLRFSMTNLLPLDYITSATTIQGNQSQNVLTEGRTTTLFAVRLELRI